MTIIAIYIAVYGILQTPTILYLNPARNHSSQKTAIIRSFSSEFPGPKLLYYLSGLLSLKESFLTMIQIYGIM